MNEDGAALGKQHGVSKYLSLSKSKDRWRNFGSKSSPPDRSGSTTPEPRPTSNSAAQNFKLNDDVVDFLKPSTNKLRPVSPKAPKIDIAAAQKWASAGPGSNGLATPSSLAKKDYPRRALNLTVRWLNSTPEVIGEGGDESDIPVIDISRRRKERGGQPEYKRANTLQSLGRAETMQNAGWANTAQNLGRAGTIQGLGRAETMQARGRGDPIQGLGRSNTIHDLERTDTEGSVYQSDPVQSMVHPQPPTPGTLLRRPNDAADQYQDLVERNPFDDQSAGADEEEQEFFPKPLRRAPTTFSSEDSANRPSMDSIRSQEPPSVTSNARSDGMKQTWQLPEFNSVMDNSPIDVTNRLEDLHFGGQHKDLESPELQTKIHRLNEEEGQALHQGSQHPVPENSAVRLSTSTTNSSKENSPADHQRNPFLASAGPTSQPRPSPTKQIYQTQQNYGSQMPTPSPSYTQPASDAQSRPPLSMRKPIGSAPPLAVPQHMTNMSREVQYEAAVPRSSPLPLTIPQQEYSPSSARNSVEQPSRSSYTSNKSQDPVSATSVASKSSYIPYTAAAKPPVATMPPNANLQAAADEFAERCSHMGGIFRLQAEYERPINDFTPMNWLRACVWWFLRGRLGIESLVRNLPRGQDGRPDSRHGEQKLTQPHVDLSKCLWILTEVIPNHPGLRPSRTSDFAQRAAEARSAGDTANVDFFEGAEMLMANLHAVLGSMQRNNMMPPTHALIQGQDQSIWLKYPALAPNLLPILSGNMSRSLTDSGTVQNFNPLAVMAVSDTRTDFSYNRMFVKASLGTEDEQVPLSCLVSVMRERNDWHLKLAICTQRDLLTIVVQGDRKRGPSWSDVKWNEQTTSIHIQLPHEYSLDVHFAEPDFRQLFNLYNHAYLVQTSLLPHSTEKVVYEVSLFDFQYNDSRKPPAFPPERIKRCRVRIFEKTEVRTEGAGQRRLYRGFRLLAVTSPKNRILGSASHDLGVRYPYIIENVSDPSNEGAPALRIHVQEDRRQCALLMVFNSPQDCERLYNTLNSMEIGPNEMQFASLRLENVGILQTDQAEAFSAASRNPLGRMHWQHLTVINNDPENPDHEVGQTIMSDGLRVIAHAAEGTLTDRMNLGPGELRIRLNTDGSPELDICRPPQDDLSISIDPSRADQNSTNLISDVQRIVFAQQTIRTYAFLSLDDLYSFQTAITGFAVRYDGLASAFSVARRRPVPALSKHKKLEATTTRIQIVSHEHYRVIQLLAFFEDFPQAEALNFVLKGMDVFERHEGKSGKGKYGVKFVDAKFTLPKVEKEERASMSAGRGRVEKRFVSLDMPEIPAENDDIIVGFDDEQGLFFTLRLIVEFMLNAIFHRTGEIPCGFTGSCSGCQRFDPETQNMIISFKITDLFSFQRAA
jgi:hypothetical protein